MGYLPPDGHLKDDYFEYYNRLADRQETELLYNIRHKVCDDYAHGLPILDFGVGSGDFIKRRPDGVSVKGFDIDPLAVDWLKENGYWLDFYKEGNIPECVTFWDSLEHLPNVKDVVNKCPKLIICAIPIFLGYEDILKSKHFRPNEHIWYFTKLGFENFMESLGFTLIMVKNLEQLAGRESIYTFVFRRFL